jgi:hypothetical protein
LDYFLQPIRIGALGLSIASWWVGWTPSLSIVKSTFKALPNWRFTHSHYLCLPFVRLRNPPSQSREALRIKIQITLLCGLKINKKVRLPSGLSDGDWPCRRSTHWASGISLLYSGDFLADWIHPSLHPSFLPSSPFHRIP